MPFAGDILHRQPSDRAYVIAIIVAYLIVSLTFALLIYLLRRCELSFALSTPSPSACFGLLLGSSFSNKVVNFGRVVRDARGAPYRYISDTRQVRKNRL